MRLLIGTQQDGPGGGIASAWLDEATGRLEARPLAAEVERPTWLQYDQARGLIFAVSEVGNRDDRIGEVLSFRASASDTTLMPVDRSASGGGGTTHLELSPDGKYLFAANFGGGQAAVFAVSDDGGLSDAHASGQHTGSGPHPRQTKPHPHGVTLDPTGRFVLVPDMGADRVFIHRFEREKGTFGGIAEEVEVPAGAGPRLLIFDRTGDYAYLLTELSAELMVFAWDGERGALSHIESLPLDPAGFSGERSAAILCPGPDGKTLYASNRRTNEIHAFRIGDPGGRAKPLRAVSAGGDKPWGAAVSPDGRWLVVANQGSGEVVSLRIARDGSLDGRVAGRVEVATPTHAIFVGM